ncbi:Alpha/Beta hydrolase protein [Globomyces pollinis-pini]|nr:Alpha/Beta hydrolase protein [Globomyces pollinis-pini]
MLDFKSLLETQSSTKFSPSSEKYIDGIDGARIAYREYAPVDNPKAILLFYHTCSFHSATANYLLATLLAQQYGILTITPDIRGHGMSGGTRGGCSNAYQVWDDITIFLDMMEKRFGNIPMFLGGHGTGAGVVLNYSYHFKIEQRLRGLIFIAPDFGFRVRILKPTTSPFAVISGQFFALNEMTGGFIFGNSTAIYFTIPKDIQESDPRIVSSITVNMANALVPINPQHQLKRLTKIPIGFWISQDDELLDHSLVADFMNSFSNHTYPDYLLSGTHFTVLSVAHLSVGPWILKSLE